MSYIFSNIPLLSLPLATVNTPKKVISLLFLVTIETALENLSRLNTPAVSSPSSFSRTLQLKSRTHAVKIRFYGYVSRMILFRTLTHVCHIKGPTLANITGPLPVNLSVSPGRHFCLAQRAMDGFTSEDRLESVDSMMCLPQCPTVTVCPTFYTLVNGLILPI